MMKTTDIIPFSECRKNLRENFDHVKKTGRPLVVTTNGKADVVVMSPGEYDKLMEDATHQRNVDAIRRSIKEFEDGKSNPAHIVHKKLKARLEAKLKDNR